VVQSREVGPARDASVLSRPGIESSVDWERIGEFPASLHRLRISLSLNLNPSPQATAGPRKEVGRPGYDPAARKRPIRLQGKVGNREERAVALPWLYPGSRKGLGDLRLPSHPRRPRPSSLPFPSFPPSSPPGPTFLHLISSLTQDGHLLQEPEGRTRLYRLR